MKAVSPEPGGNPDEAHEHIQEVKLLLGQMIRERLRATGLRQSDLSRRLGVPASQIAVWVNQPRRLSLEAVVRLLWALEARLVVGIEPVAQSRIEPHTDPRSQAAPTSRP